jgi:hypothetical protein
MLPAVELSTIPWPCPDIPLGVAKDWTRSGDDAQRRDAVALLDGLMKRYPHVLAVGQELVLALLECREYDRAGRVLAGLERAFPSLDEETLCRWGRLFKDCGDGAMRRPWADPDGRPPDPDLAERSYRIALAKYGLAYRDWSGPYAGINKATLLLVVGALRPLAPGVSPPGEVRQSEELAAELLKARPNWRSDLPDDPTVWNPATAAEAHLLLWQWPEAADLYRGVAEGRRVTPHARDAMYRQAERILAGLRNLGVTVPQPFTDPPGLFGVAPAAEPLPPLESPHQDLGEIARDIGQDPPYSE